MSETFFPFFSYSCCVDVNEARRHAKVIVPPHNAGPIVGLKKEYEFNEYEFQGGGNSHPVDEDTVEIGRHEPEHEQQEVEQQEHGRERPHSDRHEKRHQEHHEHHHIHHHPKSISHHHKKPGFSAGSGLRSIAQGSADQASSAVSNQVRKYFSLKKNFFFTINSSLTFI